MILTTRLLLLSVLGRMLRLELYVININGEPHTAVRMINKPQVALKVSAPDAETPIENAALPLPQKLKKTATV